MQGHATGDLLLQDVAKRLESIGGQNDFIARIGGDEFVLILPRLTNELAIEHMATRIIETLATPFSLNEREIQISASFGIGVYPEDGLDVSSSPAIPKWQCIKPKTQGEITLNILPRE